MPAETQGWALARATRPATVMSSPELTMTLLAGSGEVLTAARRPALARWLTRAMTPPEVAAKIWLSDESLPASRAPITAPMLGRMTVCRASHSESTYGILSATNSRVKSTAAAMRTSVRVRPCGIWLTSA